MWVYEMENDTYIFKCLDCGFVFEEEFDCDKCVDCNSENIREATDKECEELYK